MSCGWLESSPSAFRSIEMFWVRLSSDTNASGQTSFINSSFSTTRSLWRIRAASVSTALPVNTIAPSRNRRLASVSSRKRPKTKTSELLTVFQPVFTGSLRTSTPPA